MNINKIFFGTLFFLLVFVNTALAGIQVISCSMEMHLNVWEADQTAVFKNESKVGVDGGWVYTVQCYDGIKEASFFDGLDLSEAPYKLAFKGIGLGIEGIAGKILVIEYVGFSNDIVGTYYGIRASAGLGLGVDATVALGNWGQLSALGLHVGSGGSVTTSKFVIGKSWDEVYSKINSDE